MSDRLLHPHVTFVVRVLLTCVIVWAALGSIATYFAPTWPVGFDAWINFGFGVGLSTFLTIKAYQMWRPTTVMTRLGLSMILVNLAFAVAYSVLTFMAVWPQFASSPWIVNGLRIELFCFVLWASIELLIVPGKYEDPYPRLTVAMTVGALAAVMALLWRLEVLDFSWLELPPWGLP